MVYNIFPFPFIFSINILFAKNFSLKFRYFKKLPRWWGKNFYLRVLRFFFSWNSWKINFSFVFNSFICTNGKKSVIWTLSHHQLCKVVVLTYWSLKRGSNGMGEWERQRFFFDSLTEMENWHLYVILIVKK